jgi:tetratricopeptide (TPR) repeat protein
MLLLLAFLTMLAIAVLSIEVPSVVADKASYGLMALVPLAGFCASALDWVMSRGLVLRIIASAGFVSWAGASYATFWIAGGSPDGRMQAVPAIARSGEWLPAMRLLQDIAARHPDHWPSRLMLAEIMLDLEAPVGEVERVLYPRSSWPDVSSLHLVLSRMAEREGDLGRSIAEARKAAQLALEDPRPLRRLATLLAKAGESSEAMRTWREVLALDAHGVIAHRQLSALLAASGDFAGAEVHRLHSIRLGRAISALPDR